MYACRRCGTCSRGGECSREPEEGSTLPLTGLYIHVSCQSKMLIPWRDEASNPNDAPHPRADTMHSPRAPLRRDTRVFISAVSRELGTVRQSVKKALEDSSYHAVEQATFPLDYRDVVDKLRHLLASCDAVIHIAGQCFGA